MRARGLVSAYLEMKSRLLPVIVLGAAALIGSARPALAGAWVYPKGVSWFRIGFAYQSTDERYFLDGKRIPYFFEGHNETTAAFFEFRHGLGAGFEALFQLPVYNIRFDDFADDRSSTGIGDVGAGARCTSSRIRSLPRLEPPSSFPPASSSTMPRSCRWVKDNTTSKSM